MREHSGRSGPNGVSALGSHLHFLGEAQQRTPGLAGRVRRPLTEVGKGLYEGFADFFDG